MSTSTSIAIVFIVVGVILCLLLAIPFICKIHYPDGRQ